MREAVMICFKHLSRWFEENHEICWGNQSLGWDLKSDIPYTTQKC